MKNCLVILVVMILVIIACLGSAIQKPKEEARRFVESQNFTEVRITEFAPTRCRKEDIYRFAWESNEVSEAFICGGPLSRWHIAFR